MGKQIARRAKSWAPQRGKKIHGIPEPLGFAIVIVFALLLIWFAFGVF